MKTILNIRFGVLCQALALAAAVATPAIAKAQDAEPIAVLTSNAYSSAGSESSFSIRIGGNNYDGSEAWFEVDGGDGIPVEYELTPALFDEEEQTWAYTTVHIPSLRDGQVVKIYGDPSQIVYFDFEGIYATSADISKLTKLDALYASHNLLEDLDLTTIPTLQLIEVTDNPFTGETSLLIGPKPELAMLEMAIIDKVNPAFNLSDYPELRMFVAYSNYGLYDLDPTGCPHLVSLSIDASNVKAVDVSKNPELVVLNVSDSAVSSLDLSNNTKLTQLYISHGGSTHPEATFKEIDISACTNLLIFSCSYNEIAELDVSKNTQLLELYAQNNKLTTLNIDNCPDLYTLNINKNYFTFATLPENRNTFYEFYYDEMPMAVDRSYAVDMPIDLSDKVLREGTETYARVMNAITASEVSADCYTYSGGVVSFNTVMSDSIYVEFGNTAYPDYSLCTSNFVIKTAEEYGQPNKMATLGSTVDAGKRVSLFLGMAGASPSSPKQVLVDLGDGKTKTYNCTSPTFEGTYNINNVRRPGSGYIVVYTPEGDDLTSIVLEDQPLSTVDVTAATSLRELRVTGAGLYTIDLANNSRLETLALDNNNLTEIKLVNSTGTNDKLGLKHLSASHNAIATIDITDLNAMETLDLSYNNLAAMTLHAGDKLRDLNLSHNQLQAIDLSTCYVVETVNIESNQIVAFRLGSDNPITNFLCADNALSLQSLPDPAYFSGQFTYAPQAMIRIPSMGPGFDLSEQYREINGNATVFTLKTESGVTLQEGVDYSCDKGKVRFINTEAGNVHCEMTHASYPDFTGENVLRTTEMLAAGMPTNVVASFTTKDDETATLSLASNKDNSALYIDWRGTGVELEQYVLTTTYTMFTPYTYKDAEVKVYSYDEDPQITVFSILGAGISKFDGSNLTDVKTLSLVNTGIDEIVLPPSPVLAELSLDGNNFSSLDLSGYPELRVLYLDSNKFSGEFDFTPYSNLEYTSIAANELTSVKLNNPNLYSLNIGFNRIETVDLSSCTGLGELYVYENLLTEIDLESAPGLRVVDLSGNYFTLSTLPLPKDQYMIYYYSNQAPIVATCTEGTVDLSEYAEVNGTPTVYRWFVGAPTYNEETGELEGEELEVGTEFTVENGVTTFHLNIEQLVCVMTNEVFPSLFFYTYPVDISGAGVETVIDSSRRPVAVYNMQGVKVAGSKTSDLAPGLYIISYSDGTTSKCLIRR